VEHRIVELTSALVEIPTHETEEEAQRLIAGWLSGSGFACDLQEVAPGRINLVAHREGTGGTFLCSHVDVHPPHGHPDPFSCRVESGELIGRGALDAKGQIAAIVAACEQTPSARTLVAITCDEEFGGIGSENIRLPDGPWSGDGGIVCEPTSFAICTAQAGNVDIRVNVSGTAAHAYAPESSGSPIKAVLAVIEELDTCRFLKVTHPLFDRPRVNIGRIEGGEHVWRTPSSASLAMTLGVLPGTDIDGASDEVRSRLDDVARRWAARGTKLDFEIVDTSEPFDITPDRVPIASSIAAAMGVPFVPAGMPSWTDAGYLLTKHGLPCVVFGAGDLASAHSDRESVAVADLVRLSEALAGVLTRGGRAP
jgi:acetylornithine deacetylase/succinyl-diaminopimelate desuccinylase-like protein